MPRDLPSGTVTFLFTDVEGSTRLLHEMGPDAYAEALATHRRLIREACAAHGGLEVDTQGDAFFFAFPAAAGALAAAAAMTDALAAGPIAVRAGLHTGAPLLAEEGYVGNDVHLAARIAASGHGGQVILSGATAALVERELTELGEHRFKDIGEAVPIFQLGNREFPPLRTISNTNLPRPASSFVGRDAEVGEVLARLQGGARLVTLTGPGGTGKTRLALEAATTLVPAYRAGIFWVGLAALRDSGLVLEAISQVLGAKDGLAEHIGEREMLLLLDNLEQVIGAAPELSSLLGACPKLNLLVTSRELLRVQGEVEYPVPPLAMPEAVSLFCERAQLAPSDEIAELCARLDSLPLAVELAAARTKALSPSQILERLGQRLDLLRGGRDADARQQTLRATIEWSYGLLTDGEQALFSRLAVFVGGCSLAQAEQIIDAELDTLQSLVEKSLLRFARERFWMLETIREYAGEKLADSGDLTAARRRHAEWFLALASGAEPWVELAWLRGRAGVPGEWLERLETELDNIRATLEYFEEEGRIGDALRLAGALHEFWFMNQHMREAGHALARLLQKDTEPTRDRAKALMAWGDALVVEKYVSGVTARAELAAAEEALAIYRALDDPSGIAEGLWSVGVSLSSSERFEEALPHLEESFARFSTLGKDEFVLAVGWPLVWALENCGRHQQAWDVRQDLLGRARAAGNRAAQIRMLGGLGINALDLGRPASEALALIQEHLLLALQEDQHAIALALSRCAHVLARTDNFGDAVSILGRAEALWAELETLERWVAKMNEETTAVLRTHLDEAAYADAYERGRTLTLDEAVELVMEVTGPGTPTAPQDARTPPRPDIARGGGTAT